MIADDLQKFYKRNKTTKETRSKVGMPDYLFLFKQPKEIKTKELVKLFKNGTYEIV